MSAEFEQKTNNYYSELKNTESLSKRVNVNDLVSKMNEDKKKDRKNSLIWEQQRSQLLQFSE